MIIQSPARNIQRSWQTLVLRGIIAVLFGALTILFPGLTLLILVFFFAGYSLADGILACVLAIHQRSHFRYWWVIFLEGVAGIIIGLLTFIWPGVTSLILLSLITAWALITGVLELIAAFFHRSIHGFEWPLALAGFISVMLGIALISRPVGSILLIVEAIGFYAFAFGALMVFRAIRIWSEHPVQA